MNIFFSPNNDENEADEIARLKAGKHVDKKHIEKLASNAVVMLGDEYEKLYGIEKVADHELMYKALFSAWSTIMGTGVIFSVQTIEAMMIILQKLPVDEEFRHLLSNKKYNENIAILSAVRNKLIRERAERIKRSSPDLYTPGADLPK